MRTAYKCRAYPDPEQAAVCSQSIPADAAVIPWGVPWLAGGDRISHRSTDEFSRWPSLHGPERR
ncbi:helix-turn-helix domain-containing protein [Actinoallomurus sp. CA-150999]|uniref:helix-turn-helix domain-containing protein n=1 Tax=Actinoallomurus sp. CA-150999 TaxID=3239887 RepID=UPI003D8B8F6C